MAARQDEIDRAVARKRWPRSNRRRRSRPSNEGRPRIDVPVTIRYAFPDDDFALSRLAALDCSEIPRAPVLLCEANGELQVALSLADGTVVADPFRRTAWMIDLLAARAAQLQGVERLRWRILRPGRQLKLRRATVA